MLKAIESLDSVLNNQKPVVRLSTNLPNEVIFEPDEATENVEKAQEAPIEMPPYNPPSGKETIAKAKQMMKQVKK